jgi:hypothetical protein
MECVSQRETNGKPKNQTKISNSKIKKTTSKRKKATATAGDTRTVVWSAPHSYCDPGPRKSDHRVLEEKINKRIIKTANIKKRLPKNAAPINPYCGTTLL